MKEFIKKYQMGAYLVLTFLLSWGVIIPAIALCGGSASLNNPIVIVLGLLIGLAPSASSLILTSVIEGKLKSSSVIAHFKQKNRWKSYLVIALIMPAYAVLSAVLSNLLVAPYELKITPTWVILGLSWGLFSSFGEEFGWRGYFYPRLLQKRGWLVSTCIIGVIWAVWHIPMDYIGAVSYGDYMPVSILLSSLHLFFDAFIISLLYVIFKGSLKITILYHYTLCGITITLGSVFLPVVFTEAGDLHANLLGIGIKMVIAILVYITNRKAFAVGLKAQSTVLSADTMNEDVNSDKGPASALA